MSKKAKRTDVNRTATRRSTGSSAISADRTVADEVEIVDDSVTVNDADPTVTDEPEDDATPTKELSERARRRQAKKAMQVGNPSWFVPLMLTLFIIGLVWIVVFYLSQMAYPIPDITWWNLVIGFGFLMLGFAMTTRWK